MQTKKINLFFKLVKRTISKINNLSNKSWFFKKSYNYIIKTVISIVSNKKSNNSFLTILKWSSKNKQQVIYSLKKLTEQTSIKKINNQLLKHYYNILLKNLKMYNHLPIAIHFYNIKFNFKWFIEKLSACFFISVTKFYNKISYNGCRKKKLKK